MVRFEICVNMMDRDTE